MRTLVIELVLEAIEGVLLTPHGAFGRRERRLLQRRMHSFMPAVILWRCRSRAFRHNAQLHPAHRNPAEAPRRTTGEGYAVVGVNHQRQSMFVKGGVENRSDVRRIGFFDDVTAQQESAVRVGDGQRIAACAVRGAEPALEIGAPGLIGLLDLPANAPKRTGCRPWRSTIRSTRERSAPRAMRMPISRDR
jgi:hypothetical protein